MSLKLIKLLSLSVFLTACSSNTYDDVEADTQPLPELVTYQEVQFIFDNACLQCHSNPPQNGAPMSLVSFENVRDAVLTRGLIDRISLPEGESGLMPLGGPRLPQQNIELIAQWLEDGLLEN